jgi:hypothetical protein
MVPKISNIEALESYKSDFCDKYYDVLPKRSGFVQGLKA